MARLTRNPSFAEPVYTQFVEDIRKSLREGQIGPGSWLLGEHALTRKYGVSRDSIRRGIEVLAAEGLVRPVAKRGVQVTGGGAAGLSQVTVVYDCSRTGVEAADPYYGVIFREMRRSCRELGVAIEAIGHDGPQASLPPPSREATASGRGLVLLAEVSALAVPFMSSFGGPAVQVDHDLPELHCDAVLVDSRGSGALAVRRLVELGHTRIAYLGWRLEERLNPDRRQGIRDELAAHGLELAVEMNLRSAPSQQDGYGAIKSLLASEVPATAIVAFSNEIARVAVHAVEESGRKVPGDISVIGVGAIDDRRPWEKALTYVDVDAAGMAHSAIQRLRWRAANPAAPPETLAHSVRLVEGETCAGPRT